MASLYVHIPYCEKKCIYCDFYSIENHSTLSEFLGALAREIDHYALIYAGREPVETIFFGGGTPSLLSGSQIGAIIDQLRARFKLLPECEITLEANPGTVTRDSFKAYLAAGINRMSIGIQSFNQDELAFLGRIHTAAEAERAVLDAYDAGFRNVSCDLIFSLPGQTRERWGRTLARALALSPQHISAYSLIVEEHTLLSAMVKRREVTPISESADAEIFELTMEMLEDAGYEHYEISNYARPGFACRHNVNYWNHTNYLGFGPSAHSFWLTPPVHPPKRWWNERQITRYLAQIHSSPVAAAVSGFETLDQSAMAEEAIFLGLRCGRLDLDALEHAYGIDVTRRFGELLFEFEAGGFISREHAGRVIRLTPKGFLLCDAITDRLLRAQ
ncbi:MAG TPA: radical SAM family heme chaperone HemW [Bacteroidota bacterium]|nr:radical SAM family heme chaperone HemW [Bacteroidota bacterium]